MNHTTKPLDSSSTKADNKNPIIMVKPFELPTGKYEDFDPSSLLGLGLAGVSMIVKYPIVAWLSLFFSVTSIFNSSKKLVLDGAASNLSNPLQGLMFSVLALTTIYMRKFIDPMPPVITS